MIWSVFSAKDQSLCVFCLEGFLKSLILVASIPFVSPVATQV